MEACPPPADRPVRAGAPGGRPTGPARPDRVDTTPLGVPPAARAATAGRPPTSSRPTSSRSRRPAPAPGRRRRRSPSPASRWPGRGSSPPRPRARVRAASRADGAGESGLTQLLWVNALHMAGDAMIAVSLAGTLFFAAATDAQRGNVALYLLVTMAPFAVLAPVIGPALDRLQRGRRWALAGSSLGRAVLALVMAAPLRRPLALPGGARRPGAVQGAQRAARRRGPAGAAAGHVADLGQRPAVGVRAGHGGGRRRDRRPAIAGDARLRLGAAARPPPSSSPPACSRVRLPRHVDVPDRRAARPTCCTTAEIPVGRGRRRRRVSPHVVLGPAGERRAARPRRLPHDLRRVPGAGRRSPAAGRPPLALGALAAAAGRRQLRRHGGRLAAARRRPRPAGAYLGRRRPPPSPCWRRSSSASPWRSWSRSSRRSPTRWARSSLDAIIQREVPESLRASAFARSETMLQLAWVVGGALRHRAAAHRLAGLHRRRGAAGPRRRADRLEPVPRQRPRGRRRVPDVSARRTDRPRWSRSGPEQVRRCPAARRSWPAAAAARRPAPANVEVSVGAAEGRRPARPSTAWTATGSATRTRRRSSRSPPTPRSR